MEATYIDLDMQLKESEVDQETKNCLSFAALSNNYNEYTDNEDTDTLRVQENLSLSPFINHSWRDSFRDTAIHSDLSNSYSSSSPSVISDELEPDVEEDSTTNKGEKKETKGKRKNGTVAKQVSRTLQYPPCNICGGKASGDHYGVNSCEACKGFFRRYLLRKKGAYECKSGGNCEIVHTKKGMCAGCRLKKCLNVGMSKERCKLGRYSAETRTEKIRRVNEMKCGIHFTDTDFNPVSDPTKTCDIACDIITKALAGITIDDQKEEEFSDDLIPILIKLKNNMNPFGKNVNVNNRDEIKKAIRDYHEEFQLKKQLYGELGAVSKEDFTKLYRTYGIDVDNRLKEMRDSCDELDDDVFSLCNFAKHIPFFSKLSLNDQSNLLKVGSPDLHITLACQAYDPEFEVCLDKNRAFHISEMDKIISSELVQVSLNSMLKCQKLEFNESEQVLVMALSLFFTDRCFLENPHLVEKIQLSVTQLLMRNLEKHCQGAWRKRFTSIIEYLTDIRKTTDLFQKEMEEICSDDIYGNEFPILSDFLPKEGEKNT